MYLLGICSGCHRSWQSSRRGIIISSGSRLCVIVNPPLRSSLSNRWPPVPTGDTSIVTRSVLCQITGANCLAWISADGHSFHLTWIHLGMRHGSVDINVLPMSVHSVISGDAPFFPVSVSFPSTISTASAFGSDMSTTIHHHSCTWDKQHMSLSRSQMSYRTGERSHKKTTGWHSFSAFSLQILLWIYRQYFCVSIILGKEGDLLVSLLGAPY